MELLSMLKNGKSGCDGREMSNKTTASAATNTIAASISATVLCPDSDGEDEGPFFDLEFAMPAEKDEPKPDHEQRFSSSDAESTEDETELDLTASLKGSLRRDHILSFSPSDDLFFKGRIVPIVGSSSESTEKPQAAAAAADIRVKSASKFRVFKLGLHKKPPAESVDPSGGSSPKQLPPQNKFFVRLKAEEVPIMSLFTRDNSCRSSGSGRSARACSEVDYFSPDDKKMSADVLQRYLRKIKPLYVRVSKRYGEKIRFSGPLTSGGAGKVCPSAEGGEVAAGGNKDAPCSTPLTAKGQRLHSGNLPSGLRVFCQRLRKSRSASAATANVPSPAAAAAGRRDDTLLAQHDGIQSAIAHCKQSLNRGSNSPLMRSRSDPGDGRLTA